MIDVYQLNKNQSLSDIPPEWVLFGKSGAMQNLKHTLVRICSTSVSVLLQGEVGVGKNLLSRFIHQNSPWLQGPYMRLNCSTFPGWVDCVDLFALPKISRGSPSCSETVECGTAKSGTLFFDQVSELNQRLQYQVWNALAESDVAKIKKYPDTKQVRIISADTRSLRQEMRMGRFRPELFYRLAVITIDVPPLRSRIEDVPDLLEYFRMHYVSKLNVANRPFPADLLSRAVNYHWPGNIRELEGFVRRCVLLDFDRCKFGENDSDIGCNREWESTSYPGSILGTKEQLDN